MAATSHAAAASQATSLRAGAYRHYALVAIAAVGLAAGTGFGWLGRPDWSSLAFALATLPVLLALLVEITQSLRRGDVGLDVVAALSMTAALVFGEADRRLPRRLALAVLGPPKRPARTGTRPLT